MNDETDASVDSKRLFPGTDATDAPAATHADDLDAAVAGAASADGIEAPSPRDHDAGTAADDTGGSADDAGDDVPDAGAAPQGEDDGESAADDPIDWEARAEADGRSRAELLAALTAAEVERNDWLDQLRRKQAEFDNFRKRMARDGQRQRVIGQEAVARSLLDVIDDFDRTLAALEADEATRKGIQLVHDKLLVALQGQGMVRMDAAGEPFDPNLHEAVQQVAGDDEEPRVAQVLRSGWMMHDRVLRPAMVVVAQ